MNADRLTALQALCDHATAGPWIVDPDARPGGADQILYGAGLAICFMTSDGNWDDSEFISKARTALPECLEHILELLAEAKRSQDEIKSLKAALEAMDNAMNLLGIKELQHKVQRAIEIFNANPTGPAARLMHKALTLEGGA